MTDPVSSISGANWQDTTASNLILDDGDLRQAGAPEPNPNVGSVPNDQIAALAAAVAQIQQALAKQQLNNDIRAQEAASSLPSDATTDPGHHSAENDLKELQRLPQSLSYDIDNPCAYQHAKAQFKPVAEKMLAKDTRSVGELYKWLRSFRNFASTICVQNPVCFAILHLRDPAETWAQNRSLKNGTPLRDATFTQFTQELLSAPFSDAVEYYFNTVKQFCSLQQRSLPINDYANQATEIFAGRDNHPFLSTLTENHFAFVFFTGLQPQIKLHLNISPHDLMKTSFTEIVRRAQGIGLLVEQGTTNHPLAQISQPTHNKRDRTKITARPPQNLPDNFESLPPWKKKEFEKTLISENDKLWRLQTRKAQGRCTWCGDSRHSYEKCTNRKPTVNQIDHLFDSHNDELVGDAKNESQARE